MRSRIEKDEGRVLLYQLVHAYEGFEDAARAIWELLTEAQRRFPDAPRHLFLDVEGHRNSAGGYDAEMYELQFNFILQSLMPFFTEVAIPLISLENPKPQDNNVPEELKFFGPDDPQIAPHERGRMLPPDDPRAHPDRN